MLSIVVIFLWGKDIKRLNQNANVNLILLKQSLVLCIQIKILIVFNVD